MLGLTDEELETLEIVIAHESIVCDENCQENACYFREDQMDVLERLTMQGRIREEPCEHGDTYLFSTPAGREALRLHSLLRSMVQPVY